MIRQPEKPKFVYKDEKGRWSLIVQKYLPPEVIQRLIDWMAENVRKARDKSVGEQRQFFQRALDNLVISKVDLEFPNDGLEKIILETPILKSKTIISF